MNTKLLDFIFLLITLFLFVFIVLSFKSMNDYKLYSLPETAGEFTSWAIDSCKIGNKSLYITGWAAPEGTMRFKSQLFASSNTPGKYYKLNTVNFRRGNESTEMKQKGFLDNSGVFAGIRFIFTSQPHHQKIAIISLGADGEYYRGFYECNK